LITGDAILTNQAEYLALKVFQWLVLLSYPASELTNPDRKYLEFFIENIFFPTSLHLSSI